GEATGPRRGRCARRRGPRPASRRDAPAPHGRWGPRPATWCPSPGRPGVVGGGCRAPGRLVATGPLAGRLPPEGLPGAGDLEELADGLGGLGPLAEPRHRLVVVDADRG